MAADIGKKVKLSVTDLEPCTNHFARMEDECIYEKN
jgi:hypothetical protein